MVGLTYAEELVEVEVETTTVLEAALLLVEAGATEELDAELEVERTEALLEELEELEGVLATTAAELVEVFTDEEATTDAAAEEVELLTVVEQEVLAADGAGAAGAGAGAAG